MLDGKHLDNKQQEAVYLPLAQSVIVDAPPGHGKTFVMARRINYLITLGKIKAPKKILGLTFTNAAASEMLDDIKANVDKRDIDLVRVMTFHSLSYKILRAYGNLIGLERNFQIIGDIEKREYIQNATNQLSLSIGEKQYAEWEKETLLKLNKNYDGDFAPEARSVYKQYLLNLDTKIDYTTLLIKVIELFEKHPLVLEIYRSLFRYILIDEFQDTNPLQYQFLLQLVMGDRGNENRKISPPPVFILADEKQAIYRFLGATPDNNILLAEKKFNCQRIILENNYRCNSEAIVNLTNAMRQKEKMKTVSSEKVQLIISETPQEESNLILTKVRDYQGALEDIGVIAQTQYRLFSVRDCFEKNNIPYVFVPDFKAKSIEEKYTDVFSALSILHKDKNFTGKLATKIRSIYAEMQVDGENDVLNALLVLASNFDAKNRTLSFPEKALLFYNDIFVELNWGRILRKTVSGKVFLSSIHGVKGLQFSQIHILGLSNFEHIHSDECWLCKFGENFSHVKETIMDAQKTLYVGATRAQDELYLYSTRKNHKYKRRKIVGLLAPYLNCLDTQGNVDFCGPPSWINQRCTAE